MPHGAGTFLTGSTVSLRCSCSFSAAQPPALVPPRGYVSFLLAYSVVHGFWRSFVALSSGLSILFACFFRTHPRVRLGRSNVEANVQAVAMADLAAALQEAGINRIVLIRHANAAPPKADQPKKGSDGYPIHDWQRDDQMRPLTEKGKQQGAVAREWFQKDITVESNKVLVTSGAQRASQTLQLLGEQKAKPKGFLSSLLCTSNDSMAMQVSMELLPSLHPAGIAPKCEDLFDKNGYAPLGLLLCPCPLRLLFTLLPPEPKAQTAIRALAHPPPPPSLV